MSDAAAFIAQHVVEIAVDDSDIDAYEHVNNSVYLQWCDRAAWSHSLALGVSVEDCVALRRGMVVLRAELDFLRGALRGEAVTAGTAIIATDRKLRVTRRFEIRRGAELLATARMEYVCMHLDTGRAARMPPAFIDAYGRLVAGQRRDAAGRRWHPGDRARSPVANALRAINAGVRARTSPGDYSGVHLSQPCCQPPSRPRTSP